MVYHKKVENIYCNGIFLVEGEHVVFHDDQREAVKRLINLKLRKRQPSLKVMASFGGQVYSDSTRSGEMAKTGSHESGT